MATNSSAFSGSTNAKYQILYLVFNQVSQDIANNRTLFSYEAYIQSISGGSGSTTAGSYSITGATTASASSQSWSWNTTTKKTIATGSFYVSHNSDDGILANQTINISASFKTTSGTLTASTSVSLAVPTIPRASQPSLNVSTQALGSSITIYTNRASTSFTHTLTYAFGNQSGAIGTAKGVTTSQPWTLPVGLASAIPNATSGTGTITCQTYNGNDLVGTKSVSFTATVPNNATFQPTATINSVVEEGDVPPSISEFVQSKTKFNIVSSGTGKYSAKISNYQITVDGVNYYGSSVITGFINTSGNKTITLKVTDTRGYSTTVSTTRNVVAYSPPTITTFRVYRSTSVQNMAQIEFGGTFTELVGNTRYFQVSAKSSEPYAQFVEETSSDYVGYFPAEFWIGQGMTALDNLSYTLRFTVQDSFSSVVRTIDLATAFKLMNFNPSGKGMAIGKVSESDSFEVGMPTQFTVKPQFNNNEMILWDKSGKFNLANPSASYDLGSVNAGPNGGYIKVWGHGHSSAGNATYGFEYRIRLGYDGNNFSVDTISEIGGVVGAKLNFALSGSNLIVTTTQYNVKGYFERYD